MENYKKRLQYKKQRPAPLWAPGSLSTGAATTGEPRNCRARAHGGGGATTALTLSPKQAILRSKRFSEASDFCFFRKQVIIFRVI